MNCDFQAFSGWVISFFVIAVIVIFGGFLSHSFYLTDKKINNYFSLNMNFATFRQFQLEFENNGLLADKLIPSVAGACNRLVAEAMGFLKIPLVIVFVCLGQLLR